MSILLVGCRKEATIWSIAASSPDEKWTAVAHTVEHGGFGTAGVETLVEIRRKTGVRDLQTILAFMNDGPSMALRLNWVNSSHLEVVFKDDPKVLYYQVSRTSGLEISVRDLLIPESSVR